jgi:hypothetical protein
MQIDASRIAEFDVYEENDVIVFGVRFVEKGAPFDTLILHVERQDASRESDRWGVFSEIDEHVAYNVVQAFSYDASAHVLRLRFDMEKTGGVDALELVLPDPVPESRQQLLKDFEREFYVGTGPE